MRLILRAALMDIELATVDATVAEKDVSEIQHAAEVAAYYARMHAAAADANLGYNIPETDPLEVDPDMAEPAPPIQHPAPPVAPTQQSPPPVVERARAPVYTGPSLPKRVLWILLIPSRIIIRIVVWFMLGMGLSRFVCAHLLVTKWHAPRYNGANTQKDHPRKRVWWNKNIYHSVVADLWEYYWQSAGVIMTRGFFEWWDEGIVAEHAMARERLLHDDHGDSASAKSTASRAAQKHKFMTTPPHKYKTEHPFYAAGGVIVYLFMLYILIVLARRSAVVLKFTGSQPDRPMMELAQHLELRVDTNGSWRKAPNRGLAYTNPAHIQAVLSSRNFSWVTRITKGSDTPALFVPWDDLAYKGPCYAINEAHIYSPDTQLGMRLKLLYNASVAHWALDGWTAISARHYGMDMCAVVVMVPGDALHAWEPWLFVNPTITIGENAALVTTKEQSSFWPDSPPRAYTRPDVIVVHGTRLIYGAWDTTPRVLYQINTTLTGPYAWQMKGLISILDGTPDEDAA